MAESAYPPNTLRARGQCVLPADGPTVRRFVEHCQRKFKKPATIRRYLATIARVHLAARQRQARGIFYRHSWHEKQGNHVSSA